MENRSTPLIRFAGFDGDWKPKKIGMLFSERKNRSDKGELLSVTINSGIVKADSLDRKDNSSQDKGNYKKVETGDIAYNSMRMWQGASGLSNYSGIVSPAYTVITPKTGTSSLFFSYQFKLNRMIKIFRANSQGLTSDTWNLKFPLLKEIGVYAPGFDEQTLIANFFEKFDKIISLQQRELDSLKQAKQGFLKKMFLQEGETVPKIRFQGFRNPWKVRRLKNIASFSKGRGCTKNDLIDIGYPVILYGRLYTNYETNINTVDTYVASRDKCVISEGGEVIVPASGESAEDIVRASVVVESGIIIGGDLNIIKPNIGIDATFMALTISNGLPQKQLVKRAQGKSIVHLHNSDLEEVNIYLAEIDEQTIIGNFFKQFDNLIALKERELEALQQTKQGFLQKMFV